MNLDELEQLGVDTELLRASAPELARASRVELERALRAAPDWMLVEVAGDCDAESGDEHCWRCRAWGLWNDRQLAVNP